MQIKKIQIWFKSGYITPLESDTILWYVFAKCFEELKEVFYSFRDGNPPFLISNGMIDGRINRPIAFIWQHKKVNLEEDLIFEQNRKMFKSLAYIDFSREELRKCFAGEFIADEDKYTWDNGYVELSEAKNMIPRFSSGEVTPYNITNLIYTNKKYAIYVKIIDEKQFVKFYQKMQDVLLTIGRGKWVSRGYGKVGTCELLELSEQERDAFLFINDLRERQGIYLILNNYKPQDGEIDCFDLDRSYFHLVNKNTKSRGEMIFKWNMKFIAPGGVLVKKIWDSTEIKGSYYESNLSFNFWYLF